MNDQIRTDRTNSAPFGSHPIRTAGVLYSRETPDRGALHDFAQQLIGRGWRVGGIVQKLLLHPDGTRKGIDAVALDTGDTIPIARPTQEQLDSKSCSLDQGALMDSTAPLRRAVANNVDLMIVEKFGEQEQDGKGMAAEILAAMSVGIPTLVSVPIDALERWNQFSGGMADLIGFDEESLWRWWGADHLYPDLISLVPDLPVKRVVIGANWTLVEGPDGCGLAQTPARTMPGCRSVPQAGTYSEQSLRGLAEKALSWNPFETALGIAAINAAVNHQVETTEESNGLDAFAEIDGTVTAIGRFPGLKERFANLRIVETAPRDDEYPQAAGTSLLQSSEAAVITASTLVNRTLPDLLRTARNTRTALVGPGTPLTPRLFDHGLELLAGFVITDPEGAARVVAEGGGAKALRPFGRMVAITR